MPQNLGLVTVIVPQYDEGLAFFHGTLGWDILEDIPQGANRRWIVVAPPGRATGSALLLAQADGPRQVDAIGTQTAGRVGFFLYTDDFARDHARMTATGVHFLETPRTEPYGIVAKWSDPWGNLWDLIQPS